MRQLLGGKKKHTLASASVTKNLLTAYRYCAYKPLFHFQISTRKENQVLDFSTCILWSELAFCENASAKFEPCTIPKFVTFYMYQWASVCLDFETKSAKLCENFLSLTDCFGNTKAWWSSNGRFWCRNFPFDCVRRFGNSGRRIGADTSSCSISESHGR